MTRLIRIVPILPVPAAFSARRWNRALWLCCVLVTIFLPCIAIADQPQETDAKPVDSPTVSHGEAIYVAQCASCHGKAGEGVPDMYPDPLIGDASIGELSKIIDESMPEEHPEECVGDDAQAVATFIHETFYSESARIKNRPPRIGLARLTSTQLRQSLSDIYSHFVGIPEATDQRGVKGVYFNGPNWKREKIKIDRVDPVLDFDFADKGPGSGIDPKEFFIQWEGGIKPDVTGRYEIIVRSTCSFVLKFGAHDRELINNHVQSGDKTEFRRTLTLTAGRVYPFDLSFTQRKRKTEQPPAKVSMSWVTPGGVEEVIPTRSLIVGRAPSTFSLQTILPPDDRSYGYERGINVDRQWDDSTTVAALEFADTAVNELWPLYQRSHQKDSNENRRKLRAFLEELVQTAFRGPLDDQTRQSYIDKQLNATQDDAEAIKRVVLISLKSPRFLYPLADNHRTDSQRAANRLALALFDSLPADRSLIDSANKDQLKSENEIRSAATRMVNDWRTRGKTLDMLHEWLNLSHFQEMTKDKEKFPGFDATIENDLVKSLDTMLEEIVWSKESDYRQFFLADWSFTTNRLAEFYGERFQPADKDQKGMRRTANAPQHHFGILSHPYMMSGLAYNSETSPIHRGVFLIRFALGRTLNPPNEAFTPFSPDLHPDLTTRERVALQTSAENCQVCHLRINALGFALENFDAVGKFRETERGKPIDSSGSYMQQSGKEVSFTGARDLAEYLASSEDAQRAFVDRAFQHFVKQPVAAYGPETGDYLFNKFKSSGYNIRELLIEIAVIAAKPVDNQGDRNLDKDT